ncbi:hypothetical protein GGI35DRAFT_430594 [Trichoderma velutinum]
MRNEHASCIHGYHQQILLALCRSFSKFCETVRSFPPSMDNGLQLVSPHAQVRWFYCRAQADTWRVPCKYPVPRHS